MAEHQPVHHKQLDLKERLDTFSQKEKDEINQKDEKSKLRSLIMKYGRAKVAAAELKRKKEERRSGKKISWQEFKDRIETSSSSLKKGEVKTWDPETKSWKSNKEEKDIKENIGFQQSAMRKTDTGAGKGPLGSHSVRNVLKPERDKLLAKALPSVGGVQVKMDADGMVPNAGAFAQQTVSKELKNIGSSSIAKNNPMIQKGLEVAGKQNANTEFNINKNIPGTQANRFQGVADNINTKIKILRNKL